MPYKPGVKTSELWLSLAVIVGQLVAALSDSLKPQWAAIGSSVVAALYALSRGQAKQPVVPVVPSQVPVAAPVPPAQ